MHRNWHPCVVIVGVHPTNQPNISTHTQKKKKEVLEKKKKRKKMSKENTQCPVVKCYCFKILMPPTL